jgi:hypothetical protein
MGTLTNLKAATKSIQHKEVRVDCVCGIQKGELIEKVFLII